MGGERGRAGKRRVCGVVRWGGVEWSGVRGELVFLAIGELFS